MFARIGGFKPNIRFLLFGLVFTNIIFLLIYHGFLKSLLLNHFDNLQDFVNKEYYSKIFSYLEYPLIFCSIVLLLIIFFQKQIKTFLESIKDDKIYFVSIVIFSMLLQLFILIVIKTKPIADSKYYMDYGKRLFQTGSYTDPEGKLTGFWPIGLPAYLASLMFLTSRFVLVAKIINIIISALFLYTLYFLFKDELSTKGRIIFLTAFALFPNNLFSSNCILADYPFTFLLWLAVYFFVKKRNNYFWVIIISIILALMSYLRPVGLLLPFIFAAYLITNEGLRKSLKRLLLY